MTFANRMGFVKGRNPLNVEKTLENLFPKDQWRNINRFIVAHGQNVCLPLSPKCNVCPIEEYCKKVGVKQYHK